MNAEGVVVALSLVLVPAMASAQSTKLSNSELGSFAVVLGTFNERQADQPSSQRAAATIASEATGVPIAAAARATAAPVSRADRPQAATVAATAESRRIILHLDSSTEIVVFSPTGSAMQDMRIDPMAGTVELRVGQHVLSIKAPGITGISFGR